MDLDWQNGSLADHLGWASVLLMGGAASFALVIAFSTSPFSIDEGPGTALFGAGSDHNNGPESLEWSQFEERLSSVFPETVFVVDGRDGDSRYRIRLRSEFAIGDTPCRNFTLAPLNSPAVGSSHHIVCWSENGRAFLPWVYATGN